MSGENCSDAFVPRSCKSNRNFPVTSFFFDFFKSNGGNALALKQVEDVVFCRLNCLFCFHLTLDSEFIRNSTT